jgi:hypothetical protein
VNPVPECLSCVQLSDACQWCPELGLCSRMGKDRMTEEWENGGCQLTHVSRSNNGSCGGGGNAFDKEYLTIGELSAENVTDYHMFYISYVTRNPTTFDSFWRQMEVGEDQLVVLPACSTRYKSTDRVVLPFDFPFYGHPVKTVTVASGGFLSLPSIWQTSIVESQYIAPLGAEFDASYSADSTVTMLAANDAKSAGPGTVYLSGHAQTGRGHLLCIQGRAAHASQH